jgi:hypothetical protein
MAFRKNIEEFWQKVIFCQALLFLLFLPLFTLILQKHCTSMIEGTALNVVS